MVTERKKSKGDIITAEDILEANAYLPPAKLLQAVLKAIGKRNEARRIFQEWPSMKDATIRYVEYVSDLVPGPTGEPLIYVAIRRAIEGFFSEPSNNLHARIRAFVCGMVVDASMLLEYSLCAQDREGRWMCWEPFSQPIMQWTQQQINPGIRVLPAEWRISLDANMARMMLMTTVFKYHDLAAADLDICTCFQEQAEVKA